MSFEGAAAAVEGDDGFVDRIAAAIPIDSYTKEVEP
jgi:hypothetical protein